MSMQAADDSRPLENPAPLESGRTTEPLLAIGDLKVHFDLGGGTVWDKMVGGSPVKRVVKAVDGVTIDIHQGETLGLVGGSGCGKCTLGRAGLRLTEPTAGNVLFHGRDLANLSQSEMREHRRYLQMIFQDPYASLNPRMTVGQIISEPIDTFRLATGREVDRLVQELMGTGGGGPRFIKRYPPVFFGGQRQRLGIARALAA